MTASKPIVVIGGGFAGLSAATALAGAGCRVHLVEARPHLGGRAATFRDPGTGERIDNGQHLLAGCYTETLEFLQRLGAGARLHRSSTLRVPMIDERGRQTTLHLPPVAPPFDLLAGVLAWDALAFGERLAILRAGAALRRGAAPQPAETVHEWLTRHGQSAGLCKWLWEPLTLAALNQSIDEAAASAFVAVASRMFASTPDASTLLVPAVCLDELYVEPAARYLLERDARITTHAKARLVVEDGRVEAVLAGEARLEAASVICAVPWFALEGVCGAGITALGDLVSRASQMGSSPIVTVNLWFHEGVADEPWFGLPGRTFQWVFDRARLIGESQSHLSLVSSGAAAICAKPNDELVALALGELRQAVPVFAAARVRHASVVRERRATFSLRPGGPSRPDTATPVAGLWLAGDWIETGLPATIESAVVSGHRAAAAVLAHA